VTFTVYWEIRATNATTSGNFTMSATSAELTANPNLFFISSTPFYRGGELGEQMAYRIGRTAGNTGDVVVTTYGVHYRNDRLGSASVGSK
jgi:hypothetical protein